MTGEREPIAEQPVPMSSVYRSGFALVCFWGCRRHAANKLWGEVLQPKIDPLLMLFLVVALGMAVTLLLPLSSSESVADNLPPLQAGVLIE